MFEKFASSCFRFGQENQTKILTLGVGLSVITTFLVSLKNKGYAAILSFCIGVISHDPHVGMLVIINPKLLGCKILDILKAFEQILVEPVLSHRLVLTLDVGILLGLPGGCIWPESSFLRPVSEPMTAISLPC